MFFLARDRSWTSASAALPREERASSTDSCRAAIRSSTFPGCSGSVGALGSGWCSRFVSITWARASERINDNLLANALRVSPPSTTIALQRVPGAELHIVDQGPGMTEADRERAFDRFWRSSDSHQDGTGLGLPIVRHLVDASGGTITLCPVPSTGLDARIRLRPASARPSEVPPRGEDFGTGRIRGRRTQAAGRG
ncbi:sensor histidine kinase [Streptomyces griseorubiginosus]|uniref:sensor histidine kinase n=1 Tax=Streptomyces griseorubiginosus TaxID=67304 RepID=UPI0027E39C96|nr:ATP-binding protein [Streptomyces griseorubiginosus]